ncbi:retron St85 family RNA-directed DNA polymerase [Desulfovibrio sp. OttesenSCG-928-F20]|nr:retron St85 family RNA-directed DNA polymerase [Desulfovibrio sp. OttesenSCG-928-F20]
MWQEYKNEFISQAIHAGKSQKYIDTCLDYAYALIQNGLPIIFDATHLSLLVGYNKEYLFSAANSPRHFYRTFRIKKKSGGEREISEPLPSLKEIQHWILENILINIPCSKYAKAYIKKSSILQNAKFHRSQKNVLRLDIRHFFPSINLSKTYLVFYGAGYSKSVSMLLARLCSLHNGLPQGAPTSPALSNIAMKEVDSRIGGYTIKKNIRYTRYADDLVFSGDFIPGDVISISSKILGEYGFALNEKKTKLMRAHQRQRVTGLIVNKKINIQRELKRKLIQEAYYINKYGLQSHLDKTLNTSIHYIARLIGLTAFALSVNKNDKQLLTSIDIFRKSKPRKD